MKHSSFTLKLALLSALGSGVVTLAIGYSFLSIITQINYQRIDNEIRRLAYPKTLRSHDPDYWPQFEWSLRFILGDEKARQFIVKVFDRNGKVLHVSPHRPGSLADKLSLTPGDSEKHIASIQLPQNPSLRLSPLEPAVSEQQPLFGIADVNLFRLAGLPFVRTMRQPALATFTTDGEAWRVAAMGNEQVTLVIGWNLAELHAELGRYRNAFLIAAPASLLLLFVAGLWLARQALRPVRLIAQTAGHITAQNLSQRIPDTSAAREFQHLIEVINGMLDRLESSFQQASRFSADAAHELKTPLTILQGQIDQALQHAPDGSPEQGAYTNWLDEVQRLKAIVHKLLLLSQVDAGHLRATLTRVNLSELVESAAEDLRVIAPQLVLRPEIAPDIWVEADADLLNQLLCNLTSNAVKFNEQRGQIEIHLRSLAGVTSLAIANTGQTIPRKDHDQVFDRFYRADKSRGRHVDGVGLGLSLSREIARIHHGNLALQNDRDGWTTFVLTLPRCQSGQPG
ncbi:MAG: HAMP domain-containing protein [Verrucomicrobia bacterium]|nr:HAMP domain-containing protein [Verrucomicrobiota bacterium]